MCVGQKQVTWSVDLKQNLEGFSGELVIVDPDNGHGRWSFHTKNAL